MHLSRINQATYDAAALEHLRHALSEKNRGVSLPYRIIDKNPRQCHNHEDRGTNENIRINFQAALFLVWGLNFENHAILFSFVSPASSFGCDYYLHFYISIWDYFRASIVRGSYGCSNSLSLK